MSSDASYDLFLRGGHVVDPANKVDGIADVAVSDGRVAAVGPDLPGTATHSVDAGGFWVVPGLLDIHVHTYTTRILTPGGFAGGLQGDAHFLKEGVTTCVDTGTAGSEEITHFRESVIDTSKIRMFAYVNISAPGMGDAEQTVANLDPKKAAAAANDHRDVVVGIKTAHYWTKAPFDAEHPPWASVDHSVEAGQLCGMPVMVDFWPRPPDRPYDDLILKHLRPGDIHTHVFARQFPIIDDEGNVYDYMFAARDRGIHFDLGHGAASFWFRNAAPAIEQGFPPDSISTDLHMGNIHSHVHSMLDTMSKCMAMGMDFKEVIYRSTVTPARAIGHPELGTLSPGAEADIAVLRRTPGDFHLRDCGWGRIDVAERLECEMTVRAGQILWDRLGLSCPDWVDGGPDYFNLPGTQARGVARLWRDR